MHRARTKSFLAPIVRGALILTCLLGVGCVKRVTTAQRTASFQPYQNQKIGTQKLQEYLLRRTAFVIAGSKLSLEQKGTADRGEKGYFRFRVFNSASYRCGTAAAIDPRGYFLTASHNLDDGAPYVAFYRDGRVQFSPARIVWKGDYQKKKEPDLALLHIPAQLESTFSWAPNPQRGDAALAAGLDSGRGAKFRLVCFAGPILRTSPHPTPAPGQTTIFHLAPIHPGDSGGPLVAKDGGLLGLNIEIHPLTLQWLATGQPLSAAQRPDVEWLRAAIEEDVKRVN